MHRLASVSSRWPIVAIALGHQEQYCTSSPFDFHPPLSTSASACSPFLLLRLYTIRHTCAVGLVLPAFKIPRISRRARKLLSASSINNVGSSSSIAWKNADELMFEDTAGRFTN